MDLSFINQLIPSNEQVKTILLTFTLVFLYFFVNRKITQYRTKRHLTVELAKHDNFAYGLSYAGSIFGFVLIASEVLSGLSFNDVRSDTLHGIVYALLAVVFVELGRYIHDRHILFNFDENNAINHRNIAGAVVDSASVIANAICIIAIYYWSGANSFGDLPITLLMFCLSQAMLLMITRWRESQYAKANQGESMQRMLSQGNLSLSIYYAGFLIAGALAIKTGAHISHYDGAEVVSDVINFVLASTAIMILTALLSALGSKIVLANIDADIEINHQDNVGIALIEFAVTIAIALILLKVF